MNEMENIESSDRTVDKEHQTSDILEFECKE